MTLPWSARYSAYGIWLVLFVSVLVVEGVLPMQISMPPVWELVLTILATYALTGVIDHDRPLTSVWHLLRAEAAAPRPPKPTRALRTTASTVRVRKRQL
jgi:hypothetical protein